MANFGQLQLTNKGLAEQLKAQAGTQLKFSKIKMGSGTFTGNPKTLTDLVKTELSANIVKGTLSDTAYTVQAQFTNSGVTTGFYWRELGLFGVDASGNEYLYGYANCGNQADYIPPVSSSIYTKHVSIAVSVGGATNITIENPVQTYLDMVTFNQYQSEINTQISNIQSTIDSMASTSDLDSVKNDLETSLTSLQTALSALENSIESINGKIGSSSIPIGGGTIAGAINELYNLIQAIPSITSGTANPSGGESGDVYIKYD